MCRLLWKPLYLKINLDPFFKFQIDEDNVESDDDADDIAQKKKTFTGSTVIFCQAAFKRIYKVHLKDYENKYFWKWTHYNFLYTFPAL